MFGSYTEFILIGINYFETGGIWNCREATPNEMVEYPTVKDLLTSCVTSKHQEVTNCVPTEPRTCRNMHKPIQKPLICKSGCTCKSGYVLDEPNGNCIEEKSCPCHHGGQSYGEGSAIQNECNTCKCMNGTWTCTDRICAGNIINDCLSYKVLLIY